MVMVSAPYWTSGSLLEASKGVPSEHLAEDVVHIGTLRSWLGHSKLVEILAPLGVRQNIIGRLDLFELLWIATFVGVVFHSKFSVRLLDLLIGGAPLDPKISVRVHLLFNGLLLFKMFAHGRLDLSGCGRLAGGLGLANTDPLHIASLDISPGDWISEKNFGRVGHE